MAKELDVPAVIFMIQSQKVQCVSLVPELKAKHMIEAFIC